MRSFKTKLEELKKRNKLWDSRFSEVMQVREKAKVLEKNGDYHNALLLYQQEIELAKEYNFKYNIYSHSIKRTIILYGKMKRYEDLKLYLKILLVQHPEEKDIDEWNYRLEKVNNKIAKQK